MVLLILLPSSHSSRYENLGRLSTIVPFVPLQTTGRRAVVERQLEHVAKRVGDAGVRASCTSSFTSSFTASFTF